jgi:hypothetical protein
MITDDKIGIGFGRLAPMDEFGSFDGTKFTLDEARLDKEDHAAANAGANFDHVFPYGVWGKHPGGKKDSQFQPYVLDTSRDKWDLSAFNSYYFPIMRRIFEIANGVNMSVIFDWFDNCQFHGDTKKWSPWISNVQGVETFYDTDADRYTRAWILRCLDAFAGLDVIWAFGNELDNQAFPEMAERIIIPIIKSKKLDFNRMTYGATTRIVSGDSVQDLIRQAIGDQFGPVAEKNVIMEDHGWPFTDSLPVWGDRPWRKLYSDDGCYTGKSKCDTYSGQGARPSATEWGKMALDILKAYPAAVSGRERLISFEHLPAGGRSDNLDCQVETIKAISGAYRSRFGAWPSNYGKHPYVPPSPGPGPTPPEPPPEPVQDCKCSYWLTEQKQPDIWRWLKCLFGGEKRCK